VKPWLRAALLTDAFWSPANRGTLVKSPVDLVVGTLRMFEIRPMTLRPAVVGAALLGQNVMSPPNVKGWPGGDAWINSATLLGRMQFLERLFRGSDAMPPAEATAEPAPGDESLSGAQARFRRMMERGMTTYSFDWGTWSRAFAETQGRRGRMERLVLAISPVRAVPTGAEDAEFVRALVADPAYQLK
jgi:hypothetical protein